MGRRVGFYINSDKKGLKEMFTENYHDFREYTLESHNKSMEYYEGRFLDVELENFLLQNSKLKNLQNYPQEIIDSLVAEFLFDYCQYGKGKKQLKLIGPTLYTSNYIPSFQVLEKVEDSNLRKIWSFLEKGRSIQKDLFFISQEKDDSYDLIGFWKKEEIDLLKRALKEILTRLKKEDERFIARVKRKLGFNLKRRYYGFELGLEVLEALNSNQEVIFDIEY